MTVLYLNTFTAPTSRVPSGLSKFLSPIEIVCPSPLREIQAPKSSDKSRSLSISPPRGSQILFSILNTLTYPTLSSLTIWFTELAAIIFPSALILES